MNRSNSIFLKIEKELEAEIISSRAVSGGCISSARRIELSNGQTCFLKFGATQPEIYSKEARGLAEIKKSGCFLVPQIELVEEDFLLLSWVEPGARGVGFFERFGESLALMHRFTGRSFGFREDNYLGSAIQANIPSELESRDWKTFYWNKRLLFQLKWAEKQGLASRDLILLFAKMEERIEEIMFDTENIPVLLHGDLWNGNFLVGESGEPVLIDPAVYYGNREAELAMTKLFGGFDPSFYEAYQSSYPLPDGYSYRENFYKLYHIINHLNLFGTSYLREAEQLARFYVQ